MNRKKEIKEREKNGFGDSENVCIVNNLEVKFFF